MTFAGDPYRVLGLLPGASATEIKRAYRLLAKKFHPDSAGVAALPRFLAIQAAYEALIDGADRLRPGMRPGPRPAGGRGATRPNWQADPERARSARDGWRRRSAPGSGPASGGAGDRDGRGGEAGSGTRSTGSAQTAGGGQAGTGQRSRPRPGGSRSDAGTTTSGGRGGARTRARSGPAAPGGERGRTSKRRATLGSTSYDDAGSEGRTPNWDGATWYGSSSGTYWTLNPKEYADPRKHGPEYQARARRASPPGPGQVGDSVDDSHDRSAPRSSTWTGSEEPDVDDPTPRTGRRPWPPRAGWAGAASSTTAADGARAGWDWSSAERRRRRSDGAAEGIEQEFAHGSAPSADQGSGSFDHAFRAQPPFAEAVRAEAGLAERFAAWTAPAGRLLPQRVVLALIGWPPIGFALVAIAGELTGCSRFAATCTAGVRGPFDAATWVVQLAIVVALVAVPPIARVAAGGTTALLAAALPVALLLSASGGSRDPGSAGNALVFALVVAWLAGVLLSATGRLDLSAIGRPAAPG